MNSKPVTRGLNPGTSFLQPIQEQFQPKQMNMKMANAALPELQSDINRYNQRQEQANNNINQMMSFHYSMNKPSIFQQLGNDYE